MIWQALQGRSASGYSLTQRVFRTARIHQKNAEALQGQLQPVGSSLLAGGKEPLTLMGPKPNGLREGKQLAAKSEPQALISTSKEDANLRQMILRFFGK